MIRSTSFILAAIAFASLPTGTRADSIVYSDTFNSGTSMGTASAYFSDASQNNGLVVMSEDIYGSTGAPGISHDVSGNGYFLFNGTSNETVPAGQEAFYISQSFAVTAGTTYTVSFYLTNDDATAPASVEAEINGVALGAPVSAVGTFQSNGFQQFSFTYTDMTDTTATLSLLDLQTAEDGNDFGVDNILVVNPSAVPEPSSLALCGLAGAIGLVVARVRRKRALA